MSSSSPAPRRGGESVGRISPRQEFSNPDAAVGTELIAFGRRRVALSRGDDRVVSTGSADRLRERQAAVHRLWLRRAMRAAVVVVAVVVAVWALAFLPLLGL